MTGAAYTHTDVAAGRKYYYTIRAVGASGEKSGWQQEYASAMVPIAAGAGPPTPTATVTSTPGLPTPTPTITSTPTVTPASADVTGDAGGNGGGEKVCRGHHIYSQPLEKDGKGVLLLTVIDEYSRECLAVRAARSIRSAGLIEVLAEWMVLRGVPDHIRSDNGPEFTARAVREWLRRVGARTLYIEPGSPWENGLRVSTGS